MIYLILLLATVLRVIDLGSLPISLFGDEIDVAYQAWSLWTTGKDYMGNFLPAYAQGLNEWRAPLIMYFTAPFVGLLGLSTFSVRLPVALLGVADIYLIYLLTNELFSHLEIKLGKFTVSAGHLSALLLTLTPWHLHYSRANFEVTLLLALLLLGTFWFVKYLQKPQIPFSLFPLPFALTFYTYSTANLFTPLLALALLLIYRPPIKKLVVENWVVWLFTLILLFPISYHLLFGQAAGRFSLISIFSSQDLIDEIIIARTQKWVNPAREAFFHNKPLKFSSVLFTQYLQALSPQFLFIFGDPFPRHSVVGFGQLLWATLPLFLAGLYYLFRHLKGSPSLKLVLVWLLLAPLPSSMTVDGGAHATRLFILLPPLIIISALGLFQFKKLITIKKLAAFSAAVFSGALLLNFVLYFHQYSAHYRYTTTQYWHYGYREIFSKLKPYLKDEGRIFVNNTYEPSLRKFAFYTQLPPTRFHQYFKGDQVKEDLLPHFNGFKFGSRYYFGQVQPDGKSANARLSELLDSDDIYLAVQGVEAPGDWDWSQEPPSGFESLGSVSNVHGDPLFHLIRKL